PVPPSPRLPISPAPFIGAAVMALNMETITWGRIGVSDMLLTGCTCGALLAFFLAYAGAHSWYWAFYILMALAVLTKGPVGIVLPGLIVGGFLLYVGKFREVIREMKIWQGMGIFILITLPWYVLVILANGENYINTFFGYHNLERFTSVVNRHGAPWYFYFVVILVGFAPWSAYLPWSMARLEFWRRRFWQRQPREEHLGLFALIWLVVIFGFFTVAATKLPSYILPAIPGAAILVALGLAASPGLSKGLRWSGWANTVLLLVFAVLVVYLPQEMERDPAMPDFRNALIESGLPTVAGLILGLTAVAGGGVLWLIRGTGVPPDQSPPPPVSPLFFWAKAQLRTISVSRSSSLLWAVNGVGFIACFVLTVMPTYLLLDAHRQLPIRELAAIIAEVRQPGEEVVMIAFEKPSLVFYSQAHVTFFRRSLDAREYLATKADEGGSVLILGWPNKVRGVGVRLHRERDRELVYQVGNYQLVRVDKERFK
ncbi:MAG TPA: glycosyltransferase, partial [Oscillatoriaceae cyanobacterium M33_DOE_052]|nr:glycosyltransferase [Oscillatoriaceae cyanobacterium M33_DOE_052]